ncbi:hypothetical protein GYA49_00340 [Candidatus Beckwithbacteria bacterium]|nr:hypothetical protein [Candidatus Beckwithbacteria bacterium]
MKPYFYIAGIFIIAVLFSSCSPDNTDNANQAQNQKQQDVSTIVPPRQEENLQSHGTLAPEEELITLFFSLIDQKQIPEAIALMSKTAVPDDSTKQAWGVQFNAITSINILDMEAWDETNWTDNQKVYKVSLEAYVKDDPSAPIPNYGWGDNPNIRWIGLIKEDGQWKIDSISTGP